MTDPLVALAPVVRSYEVVCRLRFDILHNEQEGIVDGFLPRGYV